jgi:hypothetical protein
VADARVRAPELPGDLEWFNTIQPLTVSGQRGKVVLLDFWTYSCINCLVRQESLGAWNRLKRRSDVKLREGPGGYPVPPGKGWPPAGSASCMVSG